MSATLIWVLVIVAVATLAAWLIMVVMIAARHPAVEHPHIEPRRGRVQGGTHLGGGRSVAPRRDAEISPDDDPEEPTVPVHQSRTGPMDR
jgi:hypothetical protein